MDAEAAARPLSLALAQGTDEERAEAYATIEAAARDGAVALLVACVKPLISLLCAPASRVGVAEWRRACLLLYAMAPVDIAVAAEMVRKDADGNFTSAHFRRTGRTADGSTLAPYGCPVRYLIDKSLRTKFDEHSAPGRYRGTSTTHLSSVLLSSKNGALINVHAGMVVPDLSKAIMPQSEAMREYAASAAANAVWASLQRGRRQRQGHPPSPHCPRPTRPDVRAATRRSTDHTRAARSRRVRPRSCSRSHVAVSHRRRS